MLKHHLLFQIISVLFLGSIATMVHGQSAGPLVIVGGALKPDNQAVYEQFIQFAGGKEKARIAVIPAASGYPFESFQNVSRTLISYGLDESQIYLVPLALKDDPTTELVDESTWRLNARNDSVVSCLQTATGIWFTGGDQDRIGQILKPDNKPTKVLDIIYERYQQGIVIGGTSAGAAIMSDPMIIRGTSFGALSQGVISDTSHEENVLRLKPGLGFFPWGLIDQHFDRKARLGRLIIALLDSNTHTIHGYGIDENTALIYQPQGQIITVAGTGGITLVDVSNTSVAGQKIMNIRLGYITPGDTLYPASDILIINPRKKATRGNEYFTDELLVSGGLFQPYGDNIHDLICYQLIDQAKKDTVSGLSLGKDHKGFKIELIQTKETAGYYTSFPDGSDHYSFDGVIRNILPVIIHIEEQQK